MRSTIRNLERRIAHLEQNLRTASFDRTAAGKAQLQGVSSRTAYHDGMSSSQVANVSSAMLYHIGATENKSKFYEMVIEETGSAFWTVKILYGRLGSTGRTSDKTFDDYSQAKKFFDKKLYEKLNPRKGYVSAYSFRGEHRKNKSNYGRYPIGLTTNAGPWKNQDIAYDQALLKTTIAVVEQAIASFLDDGIVDERAVAQLMATQLKLSRNSDKLSQESANEIRLSLDRIKATGRAGKSAPEVRVRKGIAGLRKLIRRLNGAMEGGHRKLAMGEEKQVQGKDFVLRIKLHPKHTIQLTELPSKGVKTVRHIQWSNLGWLVQNYSNMFMVENLFRDLNKFSRMDFNKALKTIEDKLIEAGDIVVADYPQAEGNVARNTTPYETTLKSVEVKPLNYREISVRGKGFSVNCEWDRCTVSLDSDYDEYMAYNEGMTTFYVTKTHASARKMWKLVDAMGERGVLGYRTGEDFLDFLKSKRVGMRYVPTVWR